MLEIGSLLRGQGYGTSDRIGTDVEDRFGG
jgi:hypothetical protein